MPPDDPTTATPAAPAAPQQAPEWTPFRPLRAGDLFRLQEGEDLGEDDSPDPPEDIENDYLRYRQQQDDRELLDETRSRLNITPPAPDSETVTATQSLPALPGAGGRGQQILGASAGAYSLMRRAVPGVASDIGRGVIEAPRQALGGVSDAVHSAFSGLDHLATWLNEHVADLRLPSTGVDALDNPLAAIAGDGNQVAQPTTTTGTIVRHATRFLTGFLAAGQALQAVGLEAAVAGVAGATAAAAASAVGEKELSSGGGTTDAAARTSATRRPVRISSPGAGLISMFSRQPRSPQKASTCASVGRRSPAWRGPCQAPASRRASAPQGCSTASPRPSVVRSRRSSWSRKTSPSALRRASHSNMR